MGQYARLLTVVDLRKRHSPALNRAEMLAKEGDAAVHVMACIEPPWSWPLLDKQIRSKAREGFLLEARQRLEEQVAPLRHRGLSVTAGPMWTATPHAEILRHVEEMQPEMLIKDVERVGEFRRTFATPLDWQLLRDCDVPLHLVGEGGRAHPQKIAAAVDTSSEQGPDTPLNRRIVEAASTLALQCNAELHLVHAFNLLEIFPGDIGTAWADVAGDLRTHELENFMRFADACGVPQHCRQFLLGPPAQTLAEFVRDADVDVLVMGRIQHRGIERYVGSTTENVLYQISGSLLAIRPEA